MIGTNNKISVKSVYWRMILFQYSEYSYFMAVINIREIYT